MKKLLYVLTLLVISVTLISIERLQIVVLDASGNSTTVSLTLFSGGTANTPASQVPAENKTHTIAHNPCTEDNNRRQVVYCPPPQAA